MIERFLKAQDGETNRPPYAQALREIRSGEKQSHWIWYIFPQLEQLGQSPEAKLYGIRDLDEAKEYLSHSVLRTRLFEISEALLALSSDDPVNVMGASIDARKLCSSMTLFAAAEPDCPVFQRVLDKFFHGRPDYKTIELLKKDVRC